MTRKKEKTKSNSVKGIQEAAERLQTKIEPPIDLNDAEAFAFDSIVAGLPYEYWEPYRLRLAANLAKKIIYAEVLQAQLEDEGPLMIQANGNRVMNPLQNAIQQTYSTITSMTRTLGLSASQRGISETKMAPAKSAESKAKDILDKISKDDLLG